MILLKLKNMQMVLLPTVALIIDMYVQYDNIHWLSPPCTSSVCVMIQLGEVEVHELKPKV